MLRIMFNQAAPKAVAFVLATIILIVTFWPTPLLASAQTPQQDTLLIALEHPVGVATDHKGNIYFTEFGNAGNGTLRRLSAQGQLETLLVNLSGAAGVTVDSKNNVYFSESTAGLVARFDIATGRKVVVATGLPGAWSLAVDGSDNVYVSQRTVNGSIIQVSQNEFKVRKMLSGLRIPYGIYIHSNDTLYFAEFASNTERIGAIKKLDLKTNNTSTLVANLTGPYAVLVMNDGTTYFTLKSGELKRIARATPAIETVLSTSNRIYGLTSWQGNQILFVKFGSPIGTNDGSLNLLGGSLSLIPSTPTYEERSVIKRIADSVKPRVEEIRGLKFKHEVNITAVYREFLHKYPELVSNDSKFWQTVEIEYEALHLLRANDNAKRVIADFLYAGLLGFYEFQSERIVIITSEKNFKVDEAILAHEFTHALTAQYFPNAYQDRNETSDQSLAFQSILEGDARRVEEEYRQRCTAGIYQCELGISLSSSQTPDGLISLLLFPYLAGSNYVQRIVKDSSPRTIDYFYDRPPTSSAQIIHFLPINETQPHLASPSPLRGAGWVIIGSDTLGEASINSMFQNFALTPRVYVENILSFDSTASSGWATDTITMYSNGNETGYVWRILWNTEQDANEFETTYIKLLEHIGTHSADGRWQLRDSRQLWFERQLNLVTIVSSTHPYLDEIFPAISQRTISISDPQTRNIKNEIAKKARAGEPIIIETSINNTQAEEKEATIFLVVRGSDSKIVNQQILKTILGPNRALAVQVSWIPKSADNYTIETFVLKSPQDPTPESKTTVSSISVSE